MKRLLKLIITVYYKLVFINKCKINSFSNIILRNSKFEGRNVLGSNNYISHSFLGYASYMGSNCEFSNCLIGRYCSIGSNVRVVSADHPTKVFVSSHPFFYSGTYKNSLVKTSKFNEHLLSPKGFECEIGNDVWIGDNVLIKGGLTIGDGAVIGMGSIVLHDVLPYSIIAGVPAKLIRKRFSDEEITKLLNIKWWNEPNHWVVKNVEKFSDITMFLENISKKKVG